MLIGVDLGGTNIKAALFQQDLSLVKEQRLPTEASRGPAHVLARILEAVGNLLEENEPSIADALGIGVPGLLNMEDGISLFSPNFPNWENVPVAEWLEKRLGIPVWIDNDVRVNLYGEWLYGAGAGEQNIVLLTLGTGLGAGVIVDGHVLYGATGSAGEVGHMHIGREGRPCNCGSFGCLGRYVSARGMLRTLREKLDGGRKSVLQEWVNGDLDRITAEMVSRAFDADDLVAVETLQQTGEALGYGLVNIVNLYNPSRVILGGGMAAAGERLFVPARQVVKRHALKISAAACSIVAAKLGDAAGMLGAAAYAQHRLQTGKRF